MDAATFARHYRGGQGSEFQSTDLPLLSAAEQQLYKQLLATNARLEQEQLPAATVAAAIASTT